MDDVSVGLVQKKQLVDMLEEAVQFYTELPEDTTEEEKESTVALVEKLKNECKTVYDRMLKAEEEASRRCAAHVMKHIEELWGMTGPQGDHLAVLH